MGNGATAPPFLTSAFDGSGWSASGPGSFASAYTATGTRCVGGWVGPRAGLDAVERRIISCPCQKSNPGSSVVQPVVQSLYQMSYQVSKRIKLTIVNNLDMKTTQMSLIK
jgi:hypothetical protein